MIFHGFVTFVLEISFKTKIGVMDLKKNPLSRRIYSSDFGGFQRAAF